MGHSKRKMLIVCLACALGMIVMYFLWLFNPAGTSLLEFIRANPLIVVLLTLISIPVLAGVGYCVYKLAISYVHSKETLTSDEGGTISIETEALVSTAKRALKNVEGVTVRDVRVAVVRQKGDTSMNVDVTAVSHGDDSLVVSAAKIKDACKKSLEGFTEHEVSSVNVTFIEARRHIDPKPQKSSSSANEPMEPASTKSADTEVRATSAKTPIDNVAGAAAYGMSTSAVDGDTVEQYSYEDEGNAQDDGVQSQAYDVVEVEPTMFEQSLWSRLKQRLKGGVSRVRGNFEEDMIETDVVEAKTVPGEVASSWQDGLGDEDATHVPSDDAEGTSDYMTDDLLTDERQPSWYEDDGYRDFDSPETKEDESASRNHS